MPDNLLRPFGMVVVDGKLYDWYQARIGWDVQWGQAALLGTDKENPYWSPDSRRYYCIMNTTKSIELQIWDDNIVNDNVGTPNGPHPPSALPIFASYNAPVQASRYVALISHVLLGAHIILSGPPLLPPAFLSPFHSAHPFLPSLLQILVGSVPLNVTEMMKEQPRRGLFNAEQLLNLVSPSGRMAGKVSPQTRVTPKLLHPTRRLSRRASSHNHKP